ncbi:hypothetical protein EV182_005451, partial [Spiromyces aspiralis]
SVPEAKVTGSKVRVGSSSWPKSIKENLLLVDKSFILPQIVDNDDPILLTRPRRFGKTMCLTMFEDFFGVPRGETLEEKKARYKDMKIGADPEFIKKHCGQHPVIRLDLKASFHIKLFKRLDMLLWSFPEVQEEIDMSKKNLSPSEEKKLSHLQAMLNREWKLMETNIIYCTEVLLSLVLFLNAYYGRACILLIDEFDTPIINADEDSRDAIKNRIRDMLAPIVKTTEGLLLRCVMVSVNPVSLAEMASGLNNFSALSLHSASHEPYPDDILKSGDMLYQITFGFTEDEVRKLIATHVFP